METLSIRRTKEITVSRSIWCPAWHAMVPPSRLLQIARDVITCVKRFHDTRILHWDVSINNIMCALKKCENIFLEGGGVRVSANAPVLLAGGKDSGRDAFLNNHDLTAYESGASGETILTGTWAFIAPRRLKPWGVHHAHPRCCLCSCSVSSVWLICYPIPIVSIVIDNFSH